MRKSCFLFGAILGKFPGFPRSFMVKVKEGGYN
jgi:hypothetical protein